MAEAVRKGPGIVTLILPTGGTPQITGTVVLEANGWVTVLGPDGTITGGVSWPPQYVGRVSWE